MKRPACPLCDSTESRLCFRERGFRLLACEVCTLLFIDPYPTAATEVHRKVSTYAYESLHIQEPGKYHVASVQFYNQNFSPIDEELRTASSVLDVGCGTGHLLELLGKNRGLSRAGIELNVARAEMARRIAKCEIFELPVEDLAPGRRFEAITLINVWSHIPSLATLLASLRRLLTPRGKIILKTSECAPDVKKSAMYDWGIPDHLHFLGLSTLAYICNRYGFKVLRHDRLPMSDSLFTAARWRAPGRSGLRDAVKRVIASTPLALPLLRSAYRAIHGSSIYSSFVVLRPEEGWQSSHPNGSGQPPNA
jgi:SAM-dependent methyltransferase